jgi:hypothetical protein
LSARSNRYAFGRRRNPGQSPRSESASNRRHLYWRWRNRNKRRSRSRTFNPIHLRCHRDSNTRTLALRPRVENASSFS